jgi:SAM-dependent methyltransferase
VALTVDDLSRRRGRYGTDGGAEAIIGLAGIVLIPLVIGLALLLVGHSPWSAVPLAATVVTALVAIGYLYTTWEGKFLAWADILRGLSLGGDERVLDMGCGRGAVLLLAARLLPRGRAVGVDLWRTKDQSGNSPDAARHNAEVEGVADRVELHTGDMTAMPFEDGSFDLVVSSMAIHNIPGREGRTRAIDEAVRVLKPGGRLAIADLANTGLYAARLRERGMLGVERRGVDPRFWLGVPGVMRLVTARKPDAHSGM